MQRVQNLMGQRERHLDALGEQSLGNHSPQLLNMRTLFGGDRNTFKAWGELVLATINLIQHSQDRGTFVVVLMEDLGLQSIHHRTHIGFP